MSLFYTLPLVLRGKAVGAAGFDWNNANGVRRIIVREGADNGGVSQGGAPGARPTAARAATGESGGPARSRCSLSRAASVLLAVGN